MKKVLSILLVIVMLLSMSINVFAATTEKEITDEFISYNDAFEEKVRRAGRIIAEEKGLLVDADKFEEHRNSYESKTMSAEDTVEFYTEIRNNSITLSEIYQRFPELAEESRKTVGLDKSYVAESGSKATSADPEFGGYRSQIYYTYYERVETDEVESATYSGLANLAISIASIGLKPAQSILVSVLQTVIGSYTWTSCSDYHLTTLEERCLSGKWGEVYTSGGLLCDTDWRGYCYASRTDEYAIATAVTWRGNVCISNTTNAVRVHYAYDDKYYNSTYLRTRSLELYQQAYDETYTLLYGVLPGYVEYNWYDDYTWTSSKDNPFN